MKTVYNFFCLPVSFRFWEAFCHPAKGHCSLLQGSWCYPAGSVWYWKNCYLLFWNPAAAWLRCGAMPGLGFGPYQRTCSTDRKGYACTWWLPWCQSSCLCGWNQCSWGSEDPFSWGSCGCWNSWACVWYAAKAVTPCRIYQDVCFGWGWWNAFSWFQGSGTSFPLCVIL